jgi:hypothetical protein
MNIVFEQAVARYGPEYLQAEQTLLRAGSAAAPTLQQNLDHRDPVGRMIARCLLQWIGGKAPEYQAALDYLDQIGKRMARTPAGVPPTAGVAAELSERYGAKVADLLAVHLVKELDWPQWRVGSVLQYIMDHKATSTTSALIRFAAETNNEPWRAAAIETIRSVHDPDLATKMDYERKRYSALERKLPEALNELSETN